MWISNIEQCLEIDAKGRLSDGNTVQLSNTKYSDVGISLDLVVESSSVPLILFPIGSEYDLTDSSRVRLAFVQGMFKEEDRNNFYKQ